MDTGHKHGNPAEQFRSMLDAHMLAMRGAPGPMGMTGLPGRVVSQLSLSHKSTVSLSQGGTFGAKVVQIEP